MSERHKLVYRLVIYLKKKTLIRGYLRHLQADCVHSVTFKQRLYIYTMALHLNNGCTFKQRLYIYTMALHLNNGSTFK